MSELAKWRTRAGAAQRIRTVHGIACEASTLSKAATYGTGPTYRLINGRAAYLDADIDAWAQSKIGRPIRRAADALVAEVAA
jgi:hypothetical protein